MRPELAKSVRSAKSAIPAMLAAMIVVGATACGSSASEPDMSVETEWSPKISAALEAKGGCEVWVGKECGIWLTGMNDVAVDLGKAIDARKDAAHFGEAKELLAKFQANYGKWNGAYCSSHPADSMAITRDQNTCYRWSSDGYDAMVKLEAALRPTP